MFSKQPEIPLADLSIDLRDHDDWSVGALKAHDIPLDITTLAIEPISRILAIGTSRGVIHVFGRPGVAATINLPEAIEVRFLQFAVSTFHIVCLDCENRLHVYSLLELGKPKFVASARFDPINSITLSPSHTHIFLATQHGDIKTYDLTCLRKSPHSIPNLWHLYEEKMAASGVPSLLSPDQSSAHAIDAIIHPRNLDLLFVAYSGGVVLTDLTERSTIRVYELILLPGAPGGAGYEAHDILTHRRPMVTSLAIHPSGHFFAAGYDDGCIAFWAVDDDNKPLLVRTLHDLDVDILDPERLDALSISETSRKTAPQPPEPIFKLSWSSYPNSSDPRGGETTLTILGGLIPGEPFGVTVFLFPPCNPSEAPSDSPAPASTVHPFYCKAIRESLVPRKIFTYATRGIVQDDILLPHSTPHFSGNFDPYAILLITEVNTARTVEAYQFPPPGFLETIQIPVTHEEGINLTDKGPPGTLKPPSPSVESLSGLESGPNSLSTPFSLSIGTSGVLGGQLLQLDNEIYQSITKKSPMAYPNLNLKGGQAYAETTNESKLLKYQSHRILVTRNRDLSIRFFDFSPQLLLPTNTVESLLEHDWPEALPGLTVKIHDILEDPQSSELLMATYDNVVIESVDLACQALEVALTLKSGEVLVYRSADNGLWPPPRTAQDDTDIVLLDHIHSQSGSRMSPYFMLIGDKGPVSTCALSDIGFLAVSYQTGEIAIVDMRGPQFIYTHQKSSRKSRHSVISHLHSGAGEDSAIDIVRTLTWAICTLEKDAQPSVRLIARYQSGQAEVYTLKPSGNPVSWGVAGEPAAFKTPSDPIANGTFVLDAKTGSILKADRVRLAATFSSGTNPRQSQCFLVTIGAKGARSNIAVTGEKIGKAEWSHKVGNIQTAQVVEHMSSHALVLQTDKFDGLVYSLPSLEYICTLKLTPSSIPLAIEPGGDFVAFSPDNSAQIMKSLVYGSLFSIRRQYVPPDIDFAVSRGIVPTQPQPVSLGPASLLGSWFSYNQTLSGNAIDELLDGPDRPMPERTKSDKGSSPVLQGTTAGSAAASFAANAAAVQSNIYNRLTSAMGERGQLLGDLEERFNSLEEGSRNMVAQAKRLAAQQTAKSWFGF